MKGVKRPSDVLKVSSLAHSNLMNAFEYDNLLTDN